MKTFVYNTSPQGHKFTSFHGDEMGITKINRKVSPEQKPQKLRPVQTRHRIPQEGPNRLSHMYLFPTFLKAQGNEGVGDDKIC